MSAAGPGKLLTDQIISKPNRAAIVFAIGEKGELSFKDLKARINLGVGTLYYHLDGLDGVVTQNSAKQYILTDLGKQVYAAIKEVKGAGKPVPRTRLPSLRAVLSEVLIFDSHVERLSIDSMSNVSITFGILLTAGILAAVARIDDGIFFILARGVAPWFAVISVLISWALLFGLGALLVRLLWRSIPNLPGLAGGSALSMVPLMFAMVLEASRKTFAPTLAFLNTLYAVPYFVLYQGILVIWGAYIFTVSVRSASNLNLEKTLVVALVIVLFNLAYLWARTILFVGH